MTRLVLRDDMFTSKSIGQRETGLLLDTERHNDGQWRPLTITVVIRTHIHAGTHTVTHTHTLTHARPSPPHPRPHTQTLARACTKKKSNQQFYSDTCNSRRPYNSIGSSLEQRLPWTSPRYQMQSRRGDICFYGPQTLFTNSVDIQGNVEIFLLSITTG